MVNSSVGTELNSNLVKTAVYMNNGAYNIEPSNSEFQGTDFSKKILDNIGLVHNYDTTNYKHTFTVPQDGIYLIYTQCWKETMWSSQDSLSS